MKDILNYSRIEYDKTEFMWNVLSSSSNDCFAGKAELMCHGKVFFSNVLSPAVNLSRQASIPGRINTISSMALAAPIDSV